MMYIGCDIVAIKRIEKAMLNPAFLRILTEDERKLFDSYHDHRAIEWLAGRFAAKEAIYKAIHQIYPCVISQLAILCDQDGAPYCEIEGMQVQVSIAHEEEYATAFAVVTTKEDTK